MKWNSKHQRNGKDMQQIVKKAELEINSLVSEGKEQN